MCGQVVLRNVRWMPLVSALITIIIIIIISVSRIDLSLSYTKKLAFDFQCLYMSVNQWDSAAVFSKVLKQMYFSQNNVPKIEAFLCVPHNSLFHMSHCLCCST